MPNYDYHCPACKVTYELRQGFDAETTHTCEQCGKGIAKRVLHAPPVVFKGGGWYATDSRNKSSAVSDSETKTEKPAESSTPAASDASSPSTESPAAP